MFKSGVIDFSDEAVVVQNGKPLTAQIAITTASASTATDPSSFETQGDTVAAKSVACHLYSQQFGLAWNSGVKLEQLIQSNVNKLCDKLVSIWSALLTTTNFGSSNDFDIAGATTSDAKDNLFQDIYALASTGNLKHLICSSALYAKGAPVNLQSFDPDKGGKIRGFDGFYENAYLNSGTVKGVLTDGNGIAVIGRVPQFSSALSMESTNVEIEKLGLTVQFNRWASNASRAEYGSLDVIFGAGVYDASATKLIGQSVAASQPAAGGEGGAS